MANSELERGGIGDLFSPAGHRERLFSWELEKKSPFDSRAEKVVTK